MRRAFVPLGLTVLCLCILASPALPAQDPDYVLAIADAEGVVGGTIAIAVTLTSTGAAVTGVQFDVCDDALVDTGLGQISLGAALDERELETFAIGFAADAWSFSAVLVTGTELGASESHELVLATYELLELGESGLGFCGDLLEPQVTTATGDELEPVTVPGIITISPAPEFPFTYRVDAPAVSYDPADLSGGISFSVDLTIEEDPTSLGFPNDTSAFAMGIAHDATFLDAVAADATGVLAALNGGLGPGFAGIDIDPSDGAGVTIGVVYDLAGSDFLEFDGAAPVITVEYEVVDGALATLKGDLDGAATTLEWSDTLGTPDLVNGIVIDGDFELDVELADGTVFLVPRDVGTPFRRGDCDGNGAVSALLDALFLLTWGFGSGDDPPCLDAADVDDSGAVSALLDALYLLQWTFTGGDEPPAPGPTTCGPDVPEDDVPCDTSPDACS